MTIKLNLPLFIAAALLGSALEVLAAAADPPKFDVSQSCEGAARYAAVVGRNKETCMADERTAQNQVANNWPQYSARDRAQSDATLHCRSGGPSVTAPPPARHAVFLLDERRSRI